MTSRKIWTEKHRTSVNPTNNCMPGLKVIKLEYILRLVSASSQSLCFILSLNINSSFITSRPDCNPTTSHTVSSTPSQFRRTTFCYFFSICDNVIILEKITFSLINALSMSAIISICRALCHIMAYLSITYSYHYSNKIHK